jgi:hypothetical protein
MRCEPAFKLNPFIKAKDALCFLEEVSELYRRQTDEQRDRHGQWVNFEQRSSTQMN